MSKKDFELIADVLSEAQGIYASSPENMRENIAYIFADVLSETNPRFDRDRFLIACDVEA